MIGIKKVYLLKIFIINFLVGLLLLIISSQVFACADLGCPSTPCSGGVEPTCWQEGPTLCCQCCGTAPVVKYACNTSTGNCYESSSGGDAYNCYSSCKKVTTTTKPPATTTKPPATTTTEDPCHGCSYYCSISGPGTYPDPCGTVTCSCSTPTTTAPSTPTTTAPSTPTTTSPGSQWYNCNGGRCWGPHDPPGTDECGGSDAACEIDDPIGPVLPEPERHGFTGTVYVDLDKEGDYDKCPMWGWPPTTSASCVGDTGFPGELIPDKYKSCSTNTGINCASDSDSDCDIDHPKCISGNFCCRSNLSRCSYTRDTDGYIETDNCTSCSNTSYSCQETSVCCAFEVKKVTINATNLSNGVVYSGTTNNEGVYSLFTGLDRTAFDVSVSIDSLTPGRYIFTSENPVRQYPAPEPNYTEVNFGIYKIPANMNITGYIFNDFNENGIKDGDDTCYNGTVSVTCCGSTNEFTVSDCEPPQTWCNCSDSNTIVTLGAIDGSTIRWSGTDPDGNPIGGEETNNSAYISIPE